MISPSDLFHPSAAPHFKTFQVFILLYVYVKIKVEGSRSQWPRGLRCWSAAARQLRSWVRIPPGAWMFVCCECRVLSGRGLCDELITCPEESYRLWCVVVCDLETSWMRRPWPTGLLRQKQTTKVEGKVNPGRPWGFQEIESPRFQDSWHVHLIWLSALCTGRLSRRT